MTVDVKPLQDFMQKIARMAALKQNDVRLSMPEALQISAILAAVLSQQLVQPPSSSVFVDGGPLKR